MVGDGRRGDDLRRRYYEDECKTRDELSDNVSKWKGVTVEGGRVTRLDWYDEGLAGTIPSELGALSAL